jgi:hypothetical protein
MKTPAWMLPVVFLGTSVPAVLLMHVFDFGGEHRLLIAIGVGALATAFTQARMARRKDDGPS